MSKKIVDVVGEIAVNYLTTNELEMVNVGFTKEGPHRYLRILIDKENGVSLKDCEDFSRYLSEKLDENLIKEQYFLEVSSPGVERELFNEKDYEKFNESEVDVKLYQTVDGRKKITGILKGFTDAVIIVEDEEKTLELPRNKVSKINLHFKF